MEMPSITGWEGHLAQGLKYLRTARRGHHRPAVFNNELVFQLAAMGIEHLMAGMCQYHRQMPTDHTLSGLVTALAGVCPLDAELTRRDNVPVVLVLFPFLVDDPEQLFHGAELRRQVTDLALAHDWTVIDMTGAYSQFRQPQICDSRNDIYHPNVKGHQLAADMLYSNVVPLLEPRIHTDTP